MSNAGAGRRRPLQRAAEAVGRSSWRVIIMGMVAGPLRRNALQPSCMRWRWCVALCRDAHFTCSAHDEQ